LSLQLTPLNDLLFQALSSDYGIVVTTSDPIGLRAKLYPVRAKDAVFKCLALVLSPTSPKDELWIIKQKVKDGPQEP
jgi:hypothetical protein